MIEMFVIPRQYFVLGSIVSTSTMICVALLLTRYRELFRPAYWRFGIGILLAFLLYFIFYAGNLAIKTQGLLGMGVSNEQSIYGLFSNTPAPLLVIVFLLDAIGFESYFRGNLQSLFAARLGVGSVFVVALIDSLIHFSAMNPLFPATTFVADSVWGLNYYVTKDLYSTIASHFLWDIMIFMLLPIH